MVPLGKHMVGLLFCLGSLSLLGQSTVERIGLLPSEISESSGLLLFDGRLITHNDSGNDAVLYELDTTSLEILRRVSLPAIQNIDWEDLARDENYLYIGDIGNNLGQRRDLVIWRIPWEGYLQTDILAAEGIYFSYEDQTDFGGGQNSDWDAEALAVRGDSLWIFTKQWQSQGTTAYRLPKVPGTHTAERIADLPVGGLVTSATPLREEPGFALLGYSSQLQPFYLRLSVPEGTIPSLENTQPEELDIGFAQAEGLVASGAGRYFFTTETFSNPLVELQASLYTIETQASDEGDGSDPGNGGDPDGGDSGGGDIPGTGGGPTPGLQPNELRIFRPQGSTLLQYAHGSREAVLGRAIFDTAGRRIVFHKGPAVENPEIDISQLEQSVYYLTLYLRNLTLSEPFFPY